MILLCYDGSESSKRAVSFLHQTLSDGRVALLHVWSPPGRILADSFSARGSDPDTSPAQAKLELMAVERAREVVDDGEALAEELGLEVEILEARNRSSVWHTILDVADRVDADLIVVGTRGANAVQEQLLGSVSNGVVHHSRRPVLIVPAE
jgi:nucleotide-binding universal stress UspA family protein